MSEWRGLADLGADERVTALLAASASADWIRGRVIRVDRDWCTVATGHGSQRVQTRETLAVGDWVCASDDSEHPELVVVPRRSELARRDPEGRTQLVAANIDLVFVAAPADRLSLARVEREVAMSWDSGAAPVVLLTKCDLAAVGLAHEVRARVIGVDVIACSTASGEGIDEVAEVLTPNRTAVLLGPSGAGKSSLSNALLGHDVAATGAVREGDHRGRHVTTARELFVVPTGGVLIDTPGVRSLSLPMDHGGVSAAFPDIEERAEGCRFRDCGHEHEPGCAVLAAEAEGLLDPDRLANYRKLRSELDFELRRDDPVAARASRQVVKERTRAARKFMRERGH